MEKPKTIICYDIFYSLYFYSLISKILNTERQPVDLYQDKIIKYFDIVLRYKIFRYR